MLALRLAGLVDSMAAQPAAGADSRVAQTAAGPADSRVAQAAAAAIGADEDRP